MHGPRLSWLLLPVALTLLHQAPVAARPATSRLETSGSCPKSFQAALAARMKDRLREASRLPDPSKFAPIAGPPLRFEVSSMVASLGFDFVQKTVKAGMDFTVVSQTAALEEVYLVAAEQLLGGSMVVSDPQGPLGVMDVGQGITVVSLRQPLAAGQSVLLSMKWQGKAVCQGMCAVSSSLTYNLYTSWLPIIYDLSGMSGGPVYPTSSTLSVTVPAPLVVEASGDPLPSKPNGDGSTTFQFVEKRFGRFNVAIAPYTVETLTGSSPQVRSFLRPAVAASGAGWRKAAAEIMAFHTKEYGSYDFSKVDLVEVSDALLAGGAGGVAGLSLVFIPSSGFSADPTDWRNLQTLAHELAHQWFAFMIHNVESNTSPWLSEGMATFAEGEYATAAAAKQGFSVGPTTRRFNALIYRHLVQGADVPLSSAAVMKAATSVYAGVTYYKGALVTGMLKYLVGDAAWKTGLATYKQQYGDGATVANLLSSLKQASGKDLTGFAQKWIYDSGFPTYATALRRVPGKPVEVAIDSGSDFGLPVEVELLTADGQVLRQKLQPAGAKLTWTAAPNVEVLQVRVDPDAQILGRFLPALPGDVQVSGDVDGIDLITQAWAVGQKFSTEDMADPYKAAPFSEWADLVEDEIIDQKDLDLVLNAFGKSQS